MRDYIDAAAFKDMILCADAALHANIQMINELNVFPVPDGDTGTNMGLTLSNAATELRKRSFDSIEDASGCVSAALLRGARGNSGVILSLLFRGIAKRLKGMETAGAVEFSGAMADGVDAAYKAVMKPAEGTILTVSRLASEAAVEAAGAGASMENTLACAIEAGEEALEDTVNLNPVLKKAGVVDAGGKGYIIILKAMLASFKGEMETPAEAPDTKNSEPASSGADFAEYNTDDIRFSYCTEFIVERENTKDPALLRAFLEDLGDCVVVVDDDEIIKVHVHTNDPGKALSEAVTYGHFVTVKIENMKLQHSAITNAGSSEAAQGIKEPEVEEETIAEPEKEFGVVTVCAGSGMENLFLELGADRVVTGGQTMNPSTDDILKEINKTPASTVLVFPNNKNIIMAAEQCVPLTDKKVIVMPTKTVPQGVSALLNFNPDDGEEVMMETMKEAIDNVHTAMVTYAARDSDFDGHVIHAGEFLALLDGALLGSYTNIKTLFKELSWAFDNFSPEFITVYYGENVTESEANDNAATITGCFPEAEVSVVCGNQPVYYYMISVE